jgi:excisionase family DNA binding protein
LSLIRLPTISDDNCDTEQIMPYITKEQAAKILRTSTRGVERLVSRGKLHVTPEKVEGRTRLQPMYDEQLVQALAAEMTPDAASIATNGDDELATNKDSGDTHKREIDDAPTVEPSQALERQASAEGMQAFALMVADALQGRQTPGTATGRAVSVELKDKLTLSFKEASRLSGVPEAHLRIAYANGKLRGAKIGRGVRVSPDALKSYVAKVLK